jgi:hypothetical protein
MENTELTYEWMRQPYPITMAQTNFNVSEMRVMLRITQALQKHMEYDKERHQIQTDLFGNMMLTLATRDLMPIGDHHYEAVKKALSGLRKKPIIIKEKDAKIETSLILEYKYHYNNEKVEVLISKSLLPSYLALAKNYSRYLLEVAFNSSSTYVMKLYQYMSHWKQKGAIEVKVEELRNWMQLEDKYEHSKDLRKCILDPAAKELKERADIWFELGTPIKEGKRIVGWQLRIFRREEKQDPALEAGHAERIAKNLMGYFQLSPGQLHELQPILSKPELYKRLQDKMEAVCKHLEAQKGKIKSRAIYTLTALKKEFPSLFEATAASKAGSNTKRHPNSARLKELAELRQQIANKSREN